jgi:hypothetical protein
MVHRGHESQVEAVKITLLAFVLVIIPGSVVLV